MQAVRTECQRGGMDPIDILTSGGSSIRSRTVASKRSRCDGAPPAPQDLLLRRSPGRTVSDAVPEFNRREARERLALGTSTSRSFSLRAFFQLDGEVDGVNSRMPTGGLLEDLSRARGAALPEMGKTCCLHSSQRTHPLPRRSGAWCLKQLWSRPTPDGGHRVGRVPAARKQLQSTRP